MNKKTILPAKIDYPAAVLSIRVSDNPTNGGKIYYAYLDEGFKFLFNDRRICRAFTPPGLLSMLHYIKKIDHASN